MYKVEHDKIGSFLDPSLYEGLMLIICSSTTEGEGNPITFKKSLSIIKLRSHSSFIFQNYRITLAW